MSSANWILLSPPNDAEKHATLVISHSLWFLRESSNQSADNKIRPGPLSPQTDALSTDVNILIAVLVSDVSLLFFRSLCFMKITLSLSRYVIILTVTLLLDAPALFFCNNRNIKQKGRVNRRISHGETGRLLIGPDNTSSASNTGVLFPGTV